MDLPDDQAGAGLRLEGQARKDAVLKHWGSLLCVAALTICGVIYLIGGERVEGLLCLILARLWMEEL